MKKFEFRLSSVLRFYEAKAEVERAKLTSLMSEEQRLSAAIANLENTRQQEAASLQAVPSLERQDLRWLSSYLLCSRSQLIRLNEDLARVRRDIAEQRTAFLRAERKVQAVQKLKTRKLKEWQAAISLHFEAQAQECWLAVHHGSAVKLSGAGTTTPTRKRATQEFLTTIPPDKTGFPDTN
jgi:flagellar export protein FliJ